MLGRVGEVSFIHVWDGLVPDRMSAGVSWSRLPNDEGATCSGTTSSGVGGETPAA
jgi:hypothetical protein